MKGLDSDSPTRNINNAWQVDYTHRGPVIWRRLSWILSSSIWPSLTHWNRVTNIYASVILAVIRSDNGLSPDRRQAIICIKVAYCYIWTFGNKFQCNLNQNPTISYKKMYLKISSAKWWPSSMCCVIVGSGDGLATCCAIILIDADILSFEPLMTYFSEIWMKICEFSIRRIHAIENIVCKISVILFRYQSIKLRATNPQRMV